MILTCVAVADESCRHDALLANLPATVFTFGSEAVCALAELEDRTVVTCRRVRWASGAGYAALLAGKFCLRQ